MLFALSLLALLVWFPNDIRGGFIEPGHTGRPEPGDAFFPVLLASAICVLSAFHVLKSWVRPRPVEAGEQTGRLTRGDLSFLILFNANVIAGLAVIYWLGPLVTAAQNLFADTQLTYRQLVDTIPYKYLGYCVGGFAMTCSLIAWAEGGLRWRAAATVLAVIAACLLIFDILLVNVQLPPNADY